MAVPGQGEGNPNPLVCTSFRVVMADTDAARVIFFGAPVLWAERLVTTWLADVGCGTQDSLTRGFGLRCTANWTMCHRCASMTR
jgi:acyl-CoA thioesterase FadM